MRWWSILQHLMQERRNSWSCKLMYPRPGPARIQSLMPLSGLYSDIMLMNILNITDVSSACQPEDSYPCSGFLMRPCCLAILEIFWINRAFWLCSISVRQYVGMIGAVVHGHFFLDNAGSNPLYASGGGCRFALCFLDRFVCWVVPEGLEV